MRVQFENKRRGVRVQSPKEGGEEHGRGRIRRRSSINDACVSTLYPAAASRSHCITGSSMTPQLMMMRKKKKKMMMMIAMMTMNVMMMVMILGLA